MGRSNHWRKIWGCVTNEFNFIVCKKTSEKNKRNETSKIKHAKKTLQNKEKIDVFLENNGASKTSEIAKMLGLSEVRTRALLKEMASEGRIIASSGTKKKVYYKW